MSSEIGNTSAMSTAEAAHALGVNVATVHRMVQRGDITPALKMPGLRGAFLFNRDDVENLVAARTPRTSA